MALKVASRGSVAPFIVMEVMRAANARDHQVAISGGDRTLHLEVGQPSTGAPATVIAAAHAALGAGPMGYTEALGIPPLRAALARHYRTSQGLEVDSRRVVVTTGSSAAFLLAFLAAFEVGDRVALAAPGYPAYRNILTAVGCTPVELPVGPETRFQPTPELLAALDPQPDGLIVASPANPTGTVLDEAALGALVRHCDANGIRLVSDEIYHGITYGAPAPSALAFTEQAIIVNSFSKYFSMTGWRLGWLVLPEDLLRPVECLAQNLFISPPSLSQHAACAAFDGIAELEANVARYARNRALLLEALPRAGFGRLAPADGAFYLYADIGHTGLAAPEFCRALLEEAGIAVTPGVDFDPIRGDRYVRLSFAGATTDMEEAGRRLEAWARQRGFV